MTKTEKQIITALIRAFRSLVFLLEKIKKGEDIE